MYVNIEGVGNVYKGANYFRKFDVFICAETWAEVSGDFLSGYKKIYEIPAKKNSKKGRSSGGVTLFAKEELSKEVKILKDSLCDNTIVFEIYNIACIATYRTPDSSVYHNSEYFRKLVETIEMIQEKETTSSILCIGDINARCGNRCDGFESSKEGRWWDLQEEEPEARGSKDKETNNAGFELINICKETGLRILNGRTKSDRLGEYTFMGKQGNSVIDYALIDIMSYYKIEDLKIGKDIGSNHFPIELKINTGHDEGEVEEKKRNETAREKITMFKWREEKKSAVMREMQKNNSIFEEWWAMSLEKNEGINEKQRIMEKFMKRILKPMKKKNVKESNTRSEDEVSLLREKMDIKLKTFRYTNEARDLQEYVVARRDWKEARKIMEKKKKEEREKLVAKLYRINDWGELWKEVNKAVGVKFKKKVSDKIRDHQWEEYFKNLFNGEISETEGEWEKTSVDTVEEMDREIARREILRALKEMRGGSAPGVDGIPTNIYKNLTTVTLDKLENIFNEVMKEQKYPSGWARGIIVPIYKNKGDTKKCGNYRGIVLLPCIGKIFTKIINQRLRGWAEEKAVLPEEQAGFRAGRSTVDQLGILKSVVEQRMNKGKPTYCAFVDLKKAFDSVNRNYLWLKLARMGVSKKIIKIIESMYESATLSVRFSYNEVGEQFKTNRGVLQGSQLSALLFILFIADMPKAIRSGYENIYAVRAGDKKLEMLLFADDIVLMSEKEEGLQRMLNRLEKYCKKWDLEVNVEKTKAMVFRKGGRIKKREVWKYDGSIIETVKEFNYLGVIFKSNLKWKSHLEEKMRKATFVSNKIAALNYKYDDIPINLILRIWDAMVKPILLYGSEITDAPTQDTYEKVARAFYKKILGVSKSVCGMSVNIILGRNLLDTEIKTKRLIKWFKIQTGGNRWLTEIMKSDKRWKENIENDINKLGLSYVYMNPNIITKKKFTRIIKERMKDIDFQNNVSKLKGYKSANVIYNMNPGRTMMPAIKKTDSKIRRRAIACTVLNSFENLIKRKDNTKICKACDSDLKFENMLKHKLFECTAKRTIRKRCKVKESEAKMWDGDSVAIAEFYMERILEEGGHK